jgi:hypothetical protein
VFDAELFSLLKSDYDRARIKDGVTDSFASYVRGLVVDEQNLTNLLLDMGNSLSALAAEGLIKDRNFDFVTNEGRRNDMRRHILDSFLGDLRGMINKYYGYHSVDEFVVETLTNKVLQGMLMKLPSIWDRMVSAIKNFIHKVLGVESEDRNLLDDAVDAVMTFLKQGPATGAPVREDIDPADPVIPNNSNGGNILDDLSGSGIIDYLASLGVLKKNCK